MYRLRSGNFSSFFYRSNTSVCVCGEGRGGRVERTTFCETAATRCSFPVKEGATLIITVSITESQTWKNSSHTNTYLCLMEHHCPTVCLSVCHCQLRARTFSFFWPVVLLFVGSACYLMTENNVIVRKGWHINKSFQLSVAHTVNHVVCGFVGIPNKISDPGSLGVGVGGMSFLDDVYSKFLDDVYSKFQFLSKFILSRYNK